MLQYTPGKPRTFDYISAPRDVPLQLEGRLRRTYQDFNKNSETSGIWPANPIENPNSNSRNSTPQRYPHVKYLRVDSIRTLLPQMNAEQSPRKSMRKSTPKNGINYSAASPGNMHVLLERTPDIKEQLSRHKKRKSIKLYMLEESHDTRPPSRYSTGKNDKNMENILKPNEITLFATPKKSETLTNFPSSRGLKSAKLYYDQHSSIKNLPGTLKDRNDSIKRQERSHNHKPKDNNIFSYNAVSNSREKSTGKKCSGFNENIRIQDYLNIVSGKLNRTSGSKENSMLNYSSNPNIKLNTTSFFKENIQNYSSNQDLRLNTTPDSNEKILNYLSNNSNRMKPNLTPNKLRSPELAFSCINQKIKNPDDKKQNIFLESFRD